MAKSLAVANRGFKGISNLIIKRTEDNFVYNLPKPSGLVLNDGVEQRQNMSRNNLGEMVKVGSYDISKMPQLTISYSVFSPELYTLQTGYKFEATSTLSAGFTTFIPRNIRVPANQKVDIASIISLLDLTNLNTSTTTVGGLKELVTGSIVDATTGQSTALTYTGTGAALPTGTNEFTITSSNTEPYIYFSSDLIGYVISISIPVIFNNANHFYMTSNLVGELSVYATLVNSLNRLSFLHIPSAIIDVPGTVLDPNSETFELRMSVTSFDTCKPYNLVETQLEVKCS